MQRSVSAAKDGEAKWKTTPFPDAQPLSPRAADSGGVGEHVSLRPNRPSLVSYAKRDPGQAAAADPSASQRPPLLASEDTDAAQRPPMQQRQQSQPPHADRPPGNGRGSRPDAHPASGHDGTHERLSAQNGGGFRPGGTAAPPAYQQVGFERSQREGATLAGT